MTPNHGSSWLVKGTDCRIFFAHFYAANLEKIIFVFFFWSFQCFSKKNNFSIENFIYSKGWWNLHFWKHSGLGNQFGKAAMFLVFSISCFLCKIKIFSGHDFNIFPKRSLDQNRMFSASLTDFEVPPTGWNSYISYLYNRYWKAVMFDNLLVIFFSHDIELKSAQNAVLLSPFFPWKDDKVGFSRRVNDPLEWLNMKAVHFLLSI